MCIIVERVISHARTEVRGCVEQTPEGFKQKCFLHSGTLLYYTVHDSMSVCPSFFGQMKSITFLSKTREHVGEGSQWQINVKSMTDSSQVKKCTDTQCTSAADSQYRRLQVNTTASSR